MAPKVWFKGYALYGIVILISFLLIGNIYVIYKNSQTIEHNRLMYENAEKIKVSTVEVIRNLHLLDMALRSYALIRQEHYLDVADSCLRSKDLLFDQLENSLESQHYAMEKFNVMRDSMESYYRIARAKKMHLINDNTEAFMQLLESDPGRRAWIAFKRFEADVIVFETDIAVRARDNYKQALQNSYMLQVLLFFIAMPTLMYTAYYTTKSIKLANQLRRAKEAQVKFVEEQNLHLEKKVDERTKELLAQNEEIISQHEELAAHNDQLLLQQQEIENQRNELHHQNQLLQEANAIIEQQHAQIQVKHDDLAREVDRQTQDLKKANHELIEHNNRLEQFAYMISHNLRAPMARFIGLSSILDHAKSPEEATSITQMMIRSASELDEVIRDLGVILGVQKSGSQLLVEVNLRKAIQKIETMLSDEIRATGAQLNVHLNGTENIISVPQYVESILYNLMSNALKYRHPDRIPEINIDASDEGTFMVLRHNDNGLGIDLEQNQTKLFNLYKRFHFHVEGKGLGLYLVKTQIEALGGKVHVESKRNEGSSFILYFKK
ncbi:MAG TPA: ATP-binding protein [Ohtaekwangia sp.]|nr:ATP-binding protein [Ohtaekwangia sp.]